MLDSTNMLNDQPTHRFRLRFTLKQLFLAVALVAIGLGVWNWVFRKEVVVRAATPEDEVLLSAYPNRKRNIAVTTGRFTKDLTLLVEVFLVKSGRIEECGQHWLYRNSETSPDGPTWETIDLFLAFGEEGVLDGQATRLVVGWKDVDFMHSILNGAGKPFSLTFEHNVNPVATETIFGRITLGRPYIIHVEGSRKFTVDGKMTLKDFAKKNAGKFLVVTAKLELE